MHNIWLVAQQEFLTNVRKPSFLFAVFGIPVLMAVLYALVFYAQISAIESGVVATQYGYIDQASLVADAPDTYIAFDDVASATDALDAEEIDVFFVITPAYISTGNVPLYSYGAVAEDTRDEIETFLVSNLTTQIETDFPAERVLDPVNFTFFIESSGRELTFEGLIGLLITPVLFSVVLMVALQLSSTYLMAGVVEEKSNHIMEVLITSITPYQLLTGKMFGLGAIGLLQMLVWIVFASILFLFGGDIELLSGVSLPPSFILVVLLYFVLTYFLFSSLLAGIGAVVGSEQESRTIAGGIMFFLAVPLFFVAQLLSNPESMIFTVLMYIPFSAGITYMLLYPFTSIPASQLIMSLSILTVSTVLVTWAAARIFRWALLLEGNKASIKTLWRVIFGRQEMGTVIASKSNMEEQTA
ncbi:MAG: ABC transporter permease [Chloroflexota bacterium]